MTAAGSINCSTSARFKTSMSDGANRPEPRPPQAEGSEAAAADASASAPRPAGPRSLDISNQVSGGRIETLINVAEAGQIQLPPKRFLTAAELQKQENRTRMLE